MPRVPTLNQQKVAPTATPNVRLNTDVPIEAFGGGAAARQATGSIQKFGQEITRAMTVAQKRADDTSVLQGSNALANYDRELLKGTPNTPGLLSKRKADAAGVAHSYEKDFDGFFQGLLENAANDNQKIGLTNAYNKYRNRSLGILTQHQDSEHRKLRRDETILFVANEQEIAADSKTPEEVAESIIRQQIEIDKLADLEGLGDLETKEFKEEAESNTHIRFINRKIENDTENDLKEAMAYFEANSDSIDPDKAKDIKKNLKDASTLKEASNFVTDLFLKGYDRKTRNNKISRIKDPKLRKLARKLEEDEDKRIVARRERQSEENFRRALTIVENNPGIDPRTLKGIEPQVWNGFDNTERNALLKSSQAPINDEEKLDEFLSLSNQEVINLSEKEYQVEYRSKFGKDQKELADRIRKAAQQNDFSIGSNSFGQLAKQVLIDSGAVDAADPDSGLVNRFSFAAFQELLTKYPDRQPTEQEKIDTMKDIARRKIQQGLGFWGTVRSPIDAIRMGFFDSKIEEHQVPAFSVPKEELRTLEFELNDIPESQFKDFQTRAKSFGKQLTKDKAIRAYRALLLGQGRKAIDAIINE